MTLSNCILLAAALFFIGVYGVLTRRNIIGIFMSVELMLNAANINFVAFAYLSPYSRPQSGSMFVIFIIAVAACEMAVALAIAVTLHRKHKSLDVSMLEDLNG